jgi:hypothetical protein
MTSDWLVYAYSHQNLPDAGGHFLFAHPIFLGLIKVGLLLLNVIYLVYAVILLRQIQMMNETVKTSVSRIVMIAGMIHLGLTLLVAFYLLIM